MLVNMCVDWDVCIALFVFKQKTAYEMRSSDWSSDVCSSDLATFKPEFVNAFEIGSKNSFMNGALTLNATAFFYDYKGYQVSKIVDRTAVNEKDRQSVV